MTFGLCTTGVTVNLCGFWLPAFPSPFWVCVSVSMGSGEYFPLNFLQCDGPSWRLHAGVVPTRGVAMDTSLLCLSRWGSCPTFKAPVPKLILEMSLIIISQISESSDNVWSLLKSSFLKADFQSVVSSCCGVKLEVWNKTFILLFGAQYCNIYCCFTSQTILGAKMDPFTPGNLAKKMHFEVSQAAFWSLSGYKEQPSNQQHYKLWAILTQWTKQLWHNPFNNYYSLSKL